MSSPTTYQYTKEKLWKIYDKLPQELQEAVFSEETASNIFDVCEQNKVEEVSRVAYYAGLVLLGLILPQEFASALETDVKLPKTLADAIARDINRLVFYPVKPALEQLHRMEIEVSAKIVTPKPEEQSEQPEEQEKPEEPRGPDSYRESLE
jgi:hypothetical protein